MGKTPSIDPFVFLGKQPRTLTEPLVIGDFATVRSHSVIYAGNVIGDHLNTGHGTFIQQNNWIGDNVSIGTKSVVLTDSVIEDGVKIHTQVFLPEFAHVKKGAWLGPNSVFTNGLHPTCPKQKECMHKTTITIEESAVIGANVTTLPGIRIGKRAVIGAGSVLTRDVPDCAVFVGNPARFVKWIDELTCPFGLVEEPYGNQEKECHSLAWLSGPREP